MSVCVLGDIHFDSSKDYYVRIGEEFINWFKKWDKNNSENSLILAGDLVEKHINGGTVNDMLVRFLLASRFKKVHICVGNHDAKKVNNVTQLAYEFYKNFDNIEIYEKPTEVMVDDLNVLFLPYYWGENSEGLTINEYYSNIYKDTRFSNNYDLVIGHFTGSDISFGHSTDSVNNLDRLNTKRLMLGHIHTRFVNPNVYIGSVYAHKKGEEDRTRSAQIWDGRTWHEEELPVFSEFVTIYYPNGRPMTDAIVQIYTITNCASEKIARDRYGDIYIRTTTPDATDRKVNIQDEGGDMVDISKIDMTDMLTQFFSINGSSYSDETKRMCYGALGNL